MPSTKPLCARINIELVLTSLFCMTYKTWLRESQFYWINLPDNRVQLSMSNTICTPVEAECSYIGRRTSYSNLVAVPDTAEDGKNFEGTRGR